MENLMHVPAEEQNLRAERLIAHKCLIFRTPRLISRPENIRQESLLVPQVNECTVWMLAGLSLFLVLEFKYSPHQALNRFTCSLLQHAFPEIAIPLLFPNELNFW